MRPRHAVLVLLLCTLGAAAQPGAHVHGVVTLDIAIEPGRLTLRFEMPQQALIGHERAPRNAAERQAAAALLARLNGSAPLWHVDPALQCMVLRRRVEAPMLQAPAAHTAPAQVPSTPSTAAPEHAEVNATYELGCAGLGSGAATLRRIDLGALLDGFKGIARVEARIAGPAGQHKTSLQRPARQLAWGR